MVGISSKLDYVNLYKFITLLYFFYEKLKILFWYIYLLTTAHTQYF